MPAALRGHTDRQLFIKRQTQPLLEFNTNWTRVSVRKHHLSFSLHETSSNVSVASPGYFYAARTSGGNKESLSSPLAPLLPGSENWVEWKAVSIS